MQLWCDWWSGLQQDAALNNRASFHMTFGWIWNGGIFYIRAAGRRARSARRPAVQNVYVIAQGHGGGHASPIEAAGQWFY